MSARGKIVRRGTDAKGRPRKFIEIRDLYYDDFDFGDIVSIRKVGKDAVQKSG